MEVHLQISPKFKLCSPRSSIQISYRVKTMSCMATELAMHRGKNNFYQVLSLDHSQKIGFDEIKKAYRKMALKYHPDVCPNSSTKEDVMLRFVELRKAYETLSDPVSRRVHDCELGLIESYGWGYCRVEERRPSFPKEVWERQLSGLRRRSGKRMERTSN